MDEKKLKIIIRGSIILFALLIIGLLAYSVFYDKEIICNKQIEFKKTTNCSDECTQRCIAKGFNSEINHALLGEKISVYQSGNEVIKKPYCMCECIGCRE